MSTSWGPVADWYEKLLAGNDTYQARVILPNLLRLLEPMAGKRVLDIGCGSGFFAASVAKMGAGEVVGVDVGPELIAKAKAAVEAVGAAGAACASAFYVTSADDLSVVKESEFDVALMVLSLQNIERYQAAVAEAGKKLRKGGRLILILNHPAFRIPKQSEWGVNAQRAYQYRAVYEYLSESKATIDMAPGQQAQGRAIAGGAAGAAVGATAGIATGSATISFHRPLQAYVKALAKAGLAITGLEEWVSHKKSQPGPHQVAEDRARKEIPLFMMIDAVKGQKVQE